MDIECDRNPSILHRALFVTTVARANLAISPFRLVAFALMGAQLFVNAILSRTNQD